MWLGFLLCCVVQGGELEQSPLAKLDLTELCRRSVVSEGNQDRLHRVFEKARRGEPIALGVIGGSITQCAKASTVENRYANRVADWLRKQFPAAEVTLVNAGIGGTGSDYGCLRAQHDLLTHRPDLVIIEFSVNDFGFQERSMPAYEGLVRQVLRTPAAVLLVFTMGSVAPGTENMGKLLTDETGDDLFIEEGLVRGGNVQYWHGRIGRHYDLPMLSYRDAAWPEIKSGHLVWSDLMADLVHPNDAGHELIADIVTRYLGRVFDDADQHAALPAPLVSGRLGRVEYILAENLKPVRENGWRLEPCGSHMAWVSDQPGSEIEFAVPGTGAAAVLQAAVGQGGIAEFTVDALPATTKSCRQAQWALPVVAVLADGLDAKAHRVKIKVLPAKEGRSTVRLLGIAGTGIPDK